MDAMLSYAPATGAELRFSSVNGMLDNLQMKVEHLCSVLHVLTDVDLKECAEDTLSSLLWLLTTLISEIRAMVQIARKAV